jgi:hypothetical protein
MPAFDPQRPDCDDLPHLEWTCGCQFCDADDEPKCKGAGKKVFKSSPEARQKARASP